MAEDSVQAEIWKTTVEVQQHFNDLELKIRNFALAVLGAFLALGGYAIKDGGFVQILGCQMSVAGLIVLGALIPLFAFYLMDRLWYHRLLNGAVKAGAAQETALAAKGYVIDLGKYISAESPITMWVTKWKIHSKHKMDIFYSLLAASILGVSMVLGFGVDVRPSTRNELRIPITAQEAELVSATQQEAASRKQGHPRIDGKVSATGNRILDENKISGSPAN